MVDGNSFTKPEEKYPLLKVEEGTGDSTGQPRTIVSTMATGWIVRCSPKQSWLSRCPAFISACWMTLVLLGISFLVFYALGMSAYRRNPIIVIKCNNTHPAKNVYYHHIIPRGESIPFSSYSGYIADMATRYPALQYNIYFLLDDSQHDNVRSSRRGRFINNFFPINLINHAYNIRTDANYKRQLDDFENNYENVNITVMPLSKFMGMTPLKNHWRLMVNGKIPLSTLLFYARVFSVWHDGGISIDLTSFNNLYNKHRHVDRKVSAILQQHNDGIKASEYANVLSRADCSEGIEFFEVFATLVSRLMHETKSLFNNSLSFAQSTTENSINFNITPIKTDPRKKQDLYDNGIEKKDQMNSSDLNPNTIENMTKENNSKASDANVIISNSKISSFNENNSNGPIAGLKSHNLKANSTSLKANKNSSTFENQSNIPQLVIFYDFSLFNNAMEPSYIMPEMMFQSDIPAVQTRPEISKATSSQKKSQFLSLNSDGTFIAATSKLHPFLGQMITSAFRYVHPTFAIRDTFSIQCSTMFRDDHYCNNVFML